MATLGLRLSSNVFSEWDEFIAFLDRAPETQ